MSMIEALAAEQSPLLEKLEAFSFPETMKLLGALGTVPSLHANTLRIELLSRFATAKCNGGIIPTEADLWEWLACLDDSQIVQMEDPPEDIFIACINSNFGSFRVFAGVHLDGYYWVERLVLFLSEKLEFPGFQQAVDAVKQVLILSDAICARLDLQRYAVGSGESSGRIEPLSSLMLNTHAKAIFFTDADLTTIDITRASLKPFILSDENRRRSSSASEIYFLGERNLLVETQEGILFAFPSMTVRALIRLLVQAFSNMGGWAETFYAIDSATVFVNDVAINLGVDRCNIELPVAPESTPTLFPYTGQFDLGKPALLLTYAPEIRPVVENPYGVDKLSDEENVAFQQFVATSCKALEQLPHFTSGLVLIAISGAGRGCTLSIPDLGPNWTCFLASLNDWLILSNEPDCNTQRLWRLGQHIQLLQKHEVEVYNVSGLLALYGLWEDSHFSFIPRNLDLTLPRKAIVVAPDTGFDLRVRRRQQVDEHCVLSHHGDRWARLRRHTRTINPDHRGIFTYADVTLVREGQLLACVERGNTLWWVEAPRVGRDVPHRDTLFQLWECVTSWLNKVVNVLADKLDTFCLRSVLFLLEPSNFENWNQEPTHINSNGANNLVIEVQTESQTIRIILKQTFMNEFRKADNIAERSIVHSMIQGISSLAHLNLQDEMIADLVQKTVKHTGARYFHIVKSESVEQEISDRRKDSRLVCEEDKALLEIGLADLVGRELGTREITGKTTARKFLHDAVAKVWERIENRLAKLNHLAVVSVCLDELDTISRDEFRWKLATRALLTLDEDEQFAQPKLRSQRSDFAMASLANRLIIETSQYACPADGGVLISQTEHGLLLAEFELLTQMAAHCDALANGFIRPHVKTYANGEIEVDNDFYRDVISPYLTKQADDSIAHAYAGYEKHYEERQDAEPESSPEAEQRLAHFGKAFRSEFGFSFERLLAIADMFEGIAVQGDRTCGSLTEAEFTDLLMRGIRMNRGQAITVLNRFTLPRRKAWNNDLPKGLLEADVFPWRFRRGLSLNAKPFIQLGTNPKSWMISASHLRKSVRYFLGNLEQGRFPERHFRSNGMKRFLGDVANQKGHRFASKVSLALQEIGLIVRDEVKMTVFGAPAMPDLGDVDVLAWNTGSGTVFIVECKRLTQALSVSEAVQRLEEFKGSTTDMDKLAKHIRRVEWLKEHQEGVSIITGIEKDRIQLTPLLVTSDLVPMQFMKDIKFPTDQFVDFARLKERMQLHGFPKQGT